MNTKPEALREMLSDLLTRHYEETLKAVSETDNVQERVRLLHEAATCFGFSLRGMDT